MIPLCKANIDKREFNAVKEVLESGWLAHGLKNKEFERLFSEFIGVKHAITMNSCTSALFLSVLGHGIKGEVILPSFTFVASANAVVTAGAKAVFADIDYDTCNITAQSIEEKITDRTEAVMIVHFGGQSCQMDPIMEMAKKHKLFIIEDSAETLGGEYKERKTGSFATGCFSFFPTKNITTGEGGMLTTNDNNLAGRVKALIGHGISTTTAEREKAGIPWFRSADMPGFNFRMSNILGALGVEQMCKLEEMNKKRRKHASVLNELLSRVEEIDLPIEKENCKHVYQMYTVKVKGINRNKFVLKLREKGIGASVHFDPPVHLQNYYKKRTGMNDSLPVTEKVANTIVTLPMFPQISLLELKKISNAVQESISELKT